MARHEQDREDILAEATALVQRIEFRLADFAEPIVVGVRRDGCLSLYFGAEPVYHFNTRGQVRRMYAAGKLYKAEQGQLVSLTRVRTQHEVQLQRHELSQDEQKCWLTQVRASVLQLLAAVAEQRVEVLRQIPIEPSLLPALKTWLEALPGQLVPADSPHAK